MSVVLGPNTVPFWSRDLAVFLTKNSAIPLFVHNNDEEQSDTCFGYVAASNSFTVLPSVAPCSCSQNLDRDGVQGVELLPARFTRRALD